MIRKPDQRARGNNKPTLGQSSRNNERLSVARPRPGALTILSCTLSALEEKGDEAGEVQREKFCSLIKKKLLLSVAKNKTLSPTRESVKLVNDDSCFHQLNYIIKKSYLAQCQPKHIPNTTSDSRNWREMAVWRDSHELEHIRDCILAFVARLVSSIPTWKFCLQIIFINYS